MRDTFFLQCTHLELHLFQLGWPHHVPDSLKLLLFLFSLAQSVSDACVFLLACLGPFISRLSLIKARHRRFSRTSNPSCRTLRPQAHSSPASSPSLHFQTVAVHAYLYFTRPIYLALPDSNLPTYLHTYCTPTQCTASAHPPRPRPSLKSGFLLYFIREA